MDIDLKHTWTVSEKSWYIRFYCWLYDTTPRNISFCKLFWAYVAAPFVLLFFGLITPLAFVSDQWHAYTGRRNAVKAEKASIKRRERREHLPVVEEPAAPPKDPWQQKVLTFVENTGTKVVLAAHAVGHTLSPVTRVLGAFFGSKLFGKALLGLGVLIALAAVAAIVWAFVAFFSVTKWILIGLGAIAVGALIVAWLLAKGFDLIAGKAQATVPFWERVGDALYATALFFHIDALVAGLDRTVVGFGRTMKIGYVAVKSNTCPKIDIES